MCCDGHTLISLTMGHYRRFGEELVMDIKAEAMCPECEEISDVNASVNVPCELARRKGNDGVKEFVGDKLRAELGAGSFGPISFQKFCEQIIERTASTDLKAMAGQPFLMDMMPAGRA